MNRSINKSRLFLHAVSAAAFTIVAAGAYAQDTTVTSVRHGEPSIGSKVRNAEVVYAEGNNLVLKLENGKVEHMVVPPSEKFTIDGREVSVGNLKAGTKLTQTITTTTTPHYVNTVRTLKGKVWHVNAPSSVLLMLPDNSTHLYKVPEHAKFMINGEPKTVFQLRKGMMIEATIVTDEPQSVVAQDKTTVGQAPAQELPKLLGVLLVATPSMPQEQIASNVTAEHGPSSVTLPDTASSLPSAGLLGFLAIGSSLGLGSLRKFAGFLKG